METPKINIGEIIQKGLEKKEMTQIKLARILKKSPSLVSDWVRNRRSPNIKDFLSILTYLDLVEDFFPGYTKITNIHNITSVQNIHEEKSDVKINMEALKALINMAAKNNL